MKNYEKPKLKVLSFTANDALCAGCSVATKSQTALSNFFLSFFGDSDGNGVFSQGDIQAGSFGTAESCTTTYPGYESYCAFTATDSKLFTS